MIAVDKDGNEQINLSEFIAIMEKIIKVDTDLKAQDI